MVEKGGKYFLYRHIRPDKYIPFYIGIGTKKTKWKFGRAKTTEFRNNIWHKIVNKNNGNFIVEILLESNDYEFIKRKEIEFIKLYGRINKKTGSLANITEGGDGVVGFKHSEKTVQKLRDISTKSIPVIDMYGNYYKSAAELSRLKGIPETTLRRALNDKKNYYNYMYWEDFKNTFFIEQNN